MNQVNYPVYQEQEDHSWVKTSLGWELNVGIFSAVRKNHGGKIRQAIFFEGGLAVFDDRGQVFEIETGEAGSDPPVHVLGIYHHQGEPRAYKLRHPYTGA